MPDRALKQQNRLIAALPDDERFSVVRAMEPVDLPLAAELFRSGSDAAPLYFLTSGLASIVVTMEDGSAVECALIGSEGWVGTELFAGATPSGTVAFQRIAGSALRMSADAFQNALGEAPAFAALAGRFRGVLLAQAMQGVACNRLHEMVARAARWLLLIFDRVGAYDLAVTQEFVAQMLGTGRSAVTTALAELESRGLIERSRGHLNVRDVEGLRRVACECEGVLRGSYARYFDGFATD